MDLPTALLTPTAPPPTFAAGATTPCGTAPDAKGESFGQTLGAFLDAQPVTSLSTLGTGQAVAADGKGLPTASDEADNDSSEGDATAWMAAFVLPPVAPMTVATAPAADAPATACSSGTEAPPLERMAATTGNLLVLAKPSTQDAVLPESYGAVALAPAAETTATGAMTALALSPEQNVARLVSSDPVAPGAAVDASAASVAKSGMGSPIFQSLPTPLPLATEAAGVASVSTPRVAPSLAAAPRAFRPDALTLPHDPDTTFTASPIASASVAQAAGAAQVSDATRSPVAATAPTPAAQSRQTTAASAPPPAPTIAVTTTPQPAGQVFAAAIAAATGWRERETRASETTDAPLPIVTGTPAAAVAQAVVAAAGDAQGAALDLTQDAGLQRMIDRIEILRDTADAGDTRVRLMPDALGSVDVAVRQEGDRVHVHFTAEHDATRALIAEAQPRLTELAASRGVRIGDTSIASGGGDGPAGGNATPRQSHPAPRFARTPAPAAGDTSSIDQRLA